MQHKPPYSTELNIKKSYFCSGQHPNTGWDNQHLSQVFLELATPSPDFNMCSLFWESPFLSWLRQGTKLGQSYPNLFLVYVVIQDLKPDRGNCIFSKKSNNLKYKVRMRKKNQNSGLVLQQDSLGTVSKLLHEESVKTLRDWHFCQKKDIFVVIPERGKLIHIVTENRNRCASDPVQTNPSIPLNVWRTWSVSKTWAQMKQNL